MPMEWYIAWWNLIFLLPFGLAILYLAVMVATGLGLDSDVDSADTDLEIDADVAFDADLTLAADGGAVELQADATTGSDSAAAAEPSFLSGLLALLGVGRVPLSILILIFLMSWGAIGFLTNLYLAQEQPGANQPAISLPLAGAGSLLIMRFLGGLVGRWMPRHESYSTRRHELLGLDGEAIYAIDSTSGRVSVRSRYGDLLQLPCRVYRDARPIEKGATVRLVAYNGKQKLFYVLPVPGAETLVKGT